jgi:hypothetical protein
MLSIDYQARHRYFAPFTIHNAPDGFPKVAPRVVAELEQRRRGFPNG